MILMYCDDIERRSTAHNFYRDNGILIDAAPLGEFCSRSYSPEIEALLIVGATPPGFIGYINLSVPIISVGRYQLGDSIHFRSEFDPELVEFLKYHSSGDPYFEYNGILFGNSKSIVFLGYPLKLTSTERAILYYLVKNKEREVSVEEICEICIGDAHRKRATVSKHISEINRKAKDIGGRKMIYSSSIGHYKIKKYI